MLPQGEDKNSNQSDLFRVVQSMTIEQPRQVLPSHNSKSDLAKCFVHFFEGKLRSLCLAFDVAVPHQSHSQP